MPTKVGTKWQVVIEKDVREKYGGNRNKP